MRSWLFVFLFFAISSHACELGIYADDSIVAKGGLGAKIFPQFEKLSGCKVRIVAAPDAVQVLGRVEIDLKRGKPAADVIMGVDTLEWARVQKITSREVHLDASDTQKFVPVVRDSISKFPGLFPYDFGALTFVADTEELERLKLKQPTSLEDLTRGEWKKNFILEDPRASSPGLQFLAFSQARLGSRFSAYWSALRSQWLAMPPSWSAAYGLFVQGKAPLVWSYVTSEAYHREHGSERYRAAVLKEGQPIQIEGAALVTGAPNPGVAKLFLAFLGSPAVQDQIGATNWMWPVVGSAKVPASFAKLPKLNAPIVLGASGSGDENHEELLKSWSQVIHE